MRQPTHARQASRNRLRDHRFLGGITLVILGVALGIYALQSNDTQTRMHELLIAPLLGFACIGLGLLTRRAGLMIPGGILSGIGIGLLVALEFLPRANPVGVVALGLGLGFLSILPLTRLARHAMPGWAAVLGVPCSLVGLALIVNSQARDLLAWVETFLWPVLLLAGVALLLAAAVRLGIRRV